jgi:predicted nucleotidyltransferase
MISQIFNQDTYKILSLFSLSPGSRFNRKEIKEKTRLNNVPLDKALLKLLSSGVLARKGNYYSVNFENPSSRAIIEMCSKQYRQLREIPFDVYLLVLDLTAELSLHKGVDAYLFGSYSKLVYTENSDIDIAILAAGRLEKNRITKAVAKLEKLYGKRIETHYFDKPGFYGGKKDPLVKGILRDGIRLV